MIDLLFLATSPAAWWASRTRDPDAPPRSVRAD